MMILKITLLFLLIFLIISFYWRAQDYFYYLFQRDLKEEEDFETIDPLVYKEMQYLTNQKFLSITSKDGTQLNARFVNNYDDTFVILLHDYHSSTESLYEHGKIFYDMGYNIVIPALRAHRGSDGEFSGLGILDAQDLLDWIHALKKNFKPDIKLILYGQGIGANAIIFALDALDLDIPIILESPYSKLSNFVKRSVPLPYIPIVQIKAKRLFNISFNRQTKGALTHSNHSILLIYNKNVQTSEKQEVLEQKEYIENITYFEDLSNLNMINSYYLKTVTKFIQETKKA